MEEEGLVLNLHGEVPSNADNVCIAMRISNLLWFCHSQSFRLINESLRVLLGCMRVERRGKIPSASETTAS